MKYLFWIILTLAATCVFAVETYICKISEDGEYFCKLIRDDSSEEPVVKIDWKDI